MRRKTIGIRALKNEVSRVVDEVAERKEEYVVTDRGRPVAVLRPWREEDRAAERAARAEEIIAGIRQIAEKVGAKAGRRSAAAVVSEQRR